MTKNPETGGSPEARPKPIKPTVEEPAPPGATNGSAEDKKPEAPPPISAAEQTARIEATLSEASAAGLPSAAVFSAMWKLACTFNDSGMFKDCKNPAGCFVKIMYGHELGLSPMQSLINIDIIDGSPSMSAQLMLAKFKEAGGTYVIKQRDELGCIVDVSYQGNTIEGSFTIEDVNRAKLGGKDNHSKYPRAMMFWRCMSDAIKVVAPGALLKAYTHGELSNDQNHLSGYLTMKDGVEENSAPASTSPIARRKPPAATTTTPGKKPPAATSFASKQMIDRLQELMESAACPVPFQDKCKTFIKKYGDKCPADLTAKWMNAANAFSFATSNGDITPPTEKQMALIHNLLKSSALPEFERTNIHTRIAAEGFTKREASAYIECCQWYERNKEKLASPAEPSTKTETETGKATASTSATTGDSPDVEGSSNGDDKAGQLRIDQNTTKAMLLAEIKEKILTCYPPKRGDLTKLNAFLRSDFKGMTIIELDSWAIAVRSWKSVPPHTDPAKGNS